MSETPRTLHIPGRIGDPAEIDYSDPGGDDFEALSRDTVPVRTLRAEDLPRLIDIDRRNAGRDRTPYYTRKLAEVLDESGVRVSLVAEIEGQPVGFVMARIDFGEFGQTQPEAVLDTIGVHPGYRARKVGTALMSQLLTNLSALQIEKVRTEVTWNNFDLLRFFERRGFTPSPRLPFRLRLV